MKVIVVEDEIAASDNLKYLLSRIDSSIEVIETIDSVSTAITILGKPHAAELIFMDIHLADGISFEIFEKVKVNTPVIFTTAYDQYALKAFKVNSVDYLLKPIDKQELKEAIEKHKGNTKPQEIDNQLQGLLSMINSSKKSFKTTFLVHFKNELIPVKTEEFAYFYMDSGMVKGRTFKNATYTLDKKLEDLESELNPDLFFRVNRQYVVNKEAILSISFYFNGKLTVKVNPPSSERIVVSKAKSSELKKWMNS